MPCITPYLVRDPMNNNNTIPTDCGRCPECIKKRTSQWSFRLRQEAKVSTSAYFITLTYDTDHVPFTPTGYMTLYPDHVTKWLKILRKLHPDVTLKYYYVGEYGSQNWRPHYHMMIYNAKAELIEKSWQYGKVHYGQITGASIAYCLKYMIKDGRIPAHKNDNRLPEFGRMSKGLGISYITQEQIKFHCHPRAILERIHLVQDGKKISMPRYYKDKIYSECQKNQIQFWAKKNMDKLEKDREQFDSHDVTEAHKAAFAKMKKNKYKDKNI